MPRPSNRLKPEPLTGVLALALLGLVGGGIGDSKRPLAFTLILTGNPRGALQSCGCAGQRAGGLARRVSLIKRLKRTKPEAVLLDAGNQASEAEAAEVILAVLAKCGYNAVAVGRMDVEVGERYVKAAERYRIPLVPPDREKDTPSHVASFKLVVRAGLRVGVSSAGPVLGTNGEQRPNSSRPLCTSIEATLKAMAGRADVAVLLTDHGANNEVRVLAAGSEPRLPLIVVCLGLREVVERSGVWFVPAPASGDQVVLLTGRQVDGRLKLTVERIAVTAAEDEDPEARGLIEQYYANRYQEVVIAAALSPPHWDKMASATREECKECHAATVRSVSPHRHGKALLTLKAKERLVPECLTCHSELFRRTKRFHPDDPFAWNGVECATCHGDGILHSQIGTKDTITRKVPEEVCRGCHDKEHDPGFEYEEKLRAIQH